MIEVLGLRIYNILFADAMFKKKKKKMTKKEGIYANNILFLLD